MCRDGAESVTPKAVAKERCSQSGPHMRQLVSLQHSGGVLCIGAMMLKLLWYRL